jgi:hypothetical protein
MNYKREQRLWRDAMKCVRRGPNKYARVLRSVGLCTGAICGLLAVLFACLAVAFGPDAVAQYMGGPEFLYGVVGRGMIYLNAALIAGYLTAGWLDD